MKSTSTCELCDGTGVLSWQQPSADGRVLRTIEMDCPNGCSGHWKHPVAEQDRVIETESTTMPSTRVRGHADEAQEIGGEFITAFLRQAGH
ncbi:hypothetical protein DMH01_03220 [Amycolatopsis sp. WAC 04182]|uniref:hypothetical protein n=1 Tax=Amycolatopsis sp. WAC 04182 TaxID=2203198 RepID=UPI000F786FF3|nr:hypothetical protein [Amycolatopsis sp. WAC 04182]RSN65401.1 hypothetical protein DMH01_03220 [Amycolatopsis sp. WAC 04182]